MLVFLKKIFVMILELGVSSEGDCPNLIDITPKKVLFHTLDNSVLQCFVAENTEVLVPELGLPSSCQQWEINCFHVGFLTHQQADPLGESARPSCMTPPNRGCRCVTSVPQSSNIHQK